MSETGLKDSIIRGVVQLVRRPLYVVSMIVIPIATTLFLISLMDKGLPEKVPAAIVDLDCTEVSRNVSLTLGTLQAVDIKYKYNSFTQARDAMQRGEIYGYFMIPEQFANKALSGRKPEISFYTNLTYYVPGSLLFKGFKTTSVLTSGAIVKASLEGAGVPEYKIMPMLQPLSLHTHPLGNPWMSYAIYLANSFAPCTLALMILLVTIYSIGSEIKFDTSRDWLRKSNGSIILALFGKLLPQTIIFVSVGALIQSILYGYNHFPLNGSLANMILAMTLFVIATQSFGVFVISVLPNLRLALSVGSLVGVLSFSVGGFSFPVESMYGAIGIFSHIIPIRYYFLIYVDQALNGIPLYFSRVYYAALLIFPLISFTMLWRLKRACQKPIYIP